ncbi:glycosyltransferase family 2 protein [Candidatus Omnitrophota bacterium]
MAIIKALGKKFLKTRPAASKTPLISFIVVVHKMPRQAENTLYTLSTRYQRNVSERDYEVIVVENRSDSLMDREKALSYGSNFRYFLREEAGKSPAGALNFGFSQALAPMICIIIDGAQMATPRVVEYALCAQRISPSALIAVPGYHLGPDKQDFSLTAGYDERAKKELLGTVDCKKNGYLLFEISCFSPGNKCGFFHPLMECSCLFCSRESFEKIGGADERFNMPGGGMLNLDLYRRLGMLPESKIIVLPGEGSFHQYHEGVTTMETGNNKALYASFNKQYRELRGEEFRSPRKEPMLLGAVTYWAQDAFIKSSQNGINRFLRFQKHRKREWSDDPDPDVTGK